MGRDSFEHSDSGFGLRDTNAEEESGIHRGCRSNASSRHWGKHCGLHRGRFGCPGASGLSRQRPASSRVGTHSEFPKSLWAQPQACGSLGEAFERIHRDDAPAAGDRRPDCRHGAPSNGRHSRRLSESVRCPSSNAVSRAGFPPGGWRRRSRQSRDPDIRSLAKSVR